jgi:hypothetical protein
MPRMKLEGFLVGNAGRRSGEPLQTLTGPFGVAKRVRDLIVERFAWRCAMMVAEH